MIKVLHITNWYHSKEKPYKVPFIKEHFEALNLFTDGILAHVEVSFSKKEMLKFNKRKISKNEESYIVHSSIKSWFLKELISTLLLLFVLFTKKYRRYDIIIFHVGYPNLTYYHYIKKIIRKPIVIIEHWTAFHNNFNMSATSTKLDRIKNIYRQNISLLTVSNQLKIDIEKFSNHKQTKYIIPNVVDSELFFYDKTVKRANEQFFMVNYWREIKSPFQILNAFEKLVKTNSTAQLRIAGYGPLWKQIENFVEEKNLNLNITLLGRLEKFEIALEMQKASAFLHAAKYETFSVVCAEAICCGCPVIVSDLDAVKEFINDSNGKIVYHSTDWLSILKEYNIENFNSEKIAGDAYSKFNRNVVGNMFNRYLENILKN